MKMGGEVELEGRLVDKCVSTDMQGGVCMNRRVEYMTCKDSR